MVEHANTPIVGVARYNTDQFQMSLVCFKDRSECSISKLYICKNRN